MQVPDSKNVHAAQHASVATQDGGHTAQDSSKISELLQRATHLKKLKQELDGRAEGCKSPFVDVVNFDVKEEATCIDIAMLMAPDKCKRYFVVPLLSVFTIFIFPLKLYWSKQLQAKWLYRSVSSLNNATDVLIYGRGKPNLSRSPSRVRI
jgi:hypothetical protein